MEPEVSYRNENGTLVTVEWGEMEDGTRVPQVRLTVAGFRPDDDDGGRNAYLQSDDLERIKTIMGAMASGQLG